VTAGAATARTTARRRSIGATTILARSTEAARPATTATRRGRRTVRATARPARSSLHHATQVTELLGGEDRFQLFADLVLEVVQLAPLLLGEVELIDRAGRQHGAERGATTRLARSRAVALGATRRAAVILAGLTTPGGRAALAPRRRGAFRLCPRHRRRQRHHAQRQQTSPDHASHDILLWFDRPVLMSVV
jgi:hypothetical protein